MQQFYPGGLRLTDLPLCDGEHIIAAWRFLHTPMVILASMPHDWTAARDRVALAAVEAGLGTLPADIRT